jgi:hypothetical protein
MRREMAELLKKREKGWIGMSSVRLINVQCSSGGDDGGSTSARLDQLLIVYTKVYMLVVVVVLLKIHKYIFLVFSPL